MEKNQHVVPAGNQWAEKVKGYIKKALITRTKEETIDITRMIARKEQSELGIHGINICYSIKN